MDAARLWRIWPQISTRISIWISVLIMAPIALGISAAPAAPLTDQQASAQPAPSRAARTYALLINGGAKTRSNYASHLQHMQEVRRVLEARGVAEARIAVFNADGDDPAPDMTRDDRDDLAWLTRGTELRGTALQGADALSEVSTEWPGVELRPARESELRRWFRVEGRQLQAGDHLLIFTTDHGTAEGLDLWGERLTPAALRAMIGGLPAGVQTTLVMSQCHSGTFLDAVLTGDPATQADTCGAFSVPTDMIAFGCYADSDLGRMGFASRWIDAMQQAESPMAALREVQATDESPDVPLLSSDLYLDRVIAARGGMAATGEASRGLQAEWDRLEQAGREMEALAARWRRGASAWSLALSRLAVENYQDWVETPNAVRGDVNIPGVARGEPPTPTHAALLASLRDHAIRAGLWPLLTGMEARLDAQQRLSWEASAWKATYLRQRWAAQRAAGERLLTSAGLAKEAETYYALVACEERPWGLPAAPGTIDPGPAIPRPIPAEELRRQRPEPSSFGWSIRDGVILRAGGSAGRAGLIAGDRLLSLNRAPTPSDAALEAMVMLAPAGVPWRLEVERRSNKKVERFLLYVAPEQQL